MSDEITVNPEAFEETVNCTCPECGNTGDVPADWSGMEIECKECDERFSVSEGEQ